MTRGEDTRPGRCAFFQILCKNMVCLPGIFHIPILPFLGKGPGLQPLQKFHIHAQACKRILGRMQMQIHQTGQDQSVFVVCQRIIFKFLWQFFKHPLADSVSAYQKGIRNGSERLCGLTVADISLQYKGTCPVFFFSHVLPPMQGAIG